MNATIYARKKANDKDCYLVSNSQAVAFIEYLEWSSAQAGKESKITVSRYSGRKYNKYSFIWICIQ